MYDGLALLGLAVGYFGALFIIAAIGERAFRSSGSRPLIYALSLAVYCTSWTFFGSVGLAASSGWTFVPIYIGPILLFTVARPLLLRIVEIAKSQNLTSVADFLAARYGKSQAVAAVVTLALVIGTLPYIALQLKAIISALTTLLGDQSASLQVPMVGHVDPALIAAVVLALFAIVFGTRHVDATEHQDGLIVAVAAESVVKLAAFLTVGAFVMVSVFGGFSGMLARVTAEPKVVATFSHPPDGTIWLTYIFLSFVAAMLLPRQFHVAVVENKSPDEIRWAGWLFPAYLVLINLFVAPIAIAGLMLPQASAKDADLYVLLVPLIREAPTVAAIAMIGGLSAATAMVIVETIALAIMVSNGLVVPLLLRNRLLGAPPPARNRALRAAELTGVLLATRRMAILVITLLGFAVYVLLGQFKGLVALGLLSFAAVVQIAPAFFGGLFWRNGTARGAIAGILSGFAVWGYTLIVPWLARGGYVPMSIVDDGPWGLSALRPQALIYLQFEPIAHGVLWSLAVNTAVYIAVSLLRAPLPIERLQALTFIDDQAPRLLAMPAFRIWRTALTIADLKSTVARFLGAERTERSFARYASDRGMRLEADAEIDVQTLRFAEHLLTSAIGAASARLVLSLLFRRGNAGSASALRLLDDASEALQHNRDLLQSALDQVRHGLGVFDKDMRLICWNRQYRELLGLPAGLGRVGTRLDLILRALAERGDFGDGSIDDLVADRLVRIAVSRETLLERIAPDGRFIEVRTSAMPQGGIVITYLDVTDRVNAALALQQANTTLEERVRERTTEILDVNAALDVAKRAADEANREKTRLLVGASHDLLQPLSAARLYATSLLERPLAEEERRIAGNLEASLGSVEEILGALIDISKIDSGRLEPEITDVPLQALFDQLKVEFGPIAAAKGLELRVVATSLFVRTDRRLLRRVLQNFVSNAVKYTRSGGILMGARRNGRYVTVSVFDTGPGIPEAKQALVFKEFQRLESNQTERGLGLGLSIVERIGRVLAARIELRSVVGRGSAFSISVPLGAAAIQPATDTGTRRPPGRPASQLEGCHVLCIDNDPHVLAGMTALLAGWGCRVTVAADRDSALSSVLGVRVAPDLMLVDYHLDVGTGVEIARELRFLLGVEVPVIVVTADQTPEIQRELRDNGFTLLRKPVRVAALRAVMTQHLMARTAAAAE